MCCHFPRWRKSHRLLAPAFTRLFSCFENHRAIGYCYHNFSLFPPPTHTPSENKAKAFEERKVPWTWRRRCCSRSVARRNNLLPLATIREIPRSSSDSLELCWTSRPGELSLGRMSWDLAEHHRNSANSSTPHLQSVFHPGVSAKGQLYAAVGFTSPYILQEAGGRGARWNSKQTYP